MTSSSKRPRSSRRDSGPTIASILAPIHADWMRRTRRAVEPVLSPEASFWDRWTTIRYVDDLFDHHYRHEVALVGSVVPLLPASVAARLTTLTETLDEALARLDQLGRRRGMARAVSVIAREFLDLLQLWCAEVEEAVGELRRKDLPEPSERLLVALEAAATAES